MCVYVHFCELSIIMYMYRKRCVCERTLSVERKRFLDLTHRRVVESLSAGSRFQGLRWNIKYNKARQTVCVCTVSTVGVRELVCVSTVSTQAV